MLRYTVQRKAAHVKLDGLRVLTVARRGVVEAGPKLKSRSSSVLRDMGDPSTGGSHGRLAGCAVACFKPSSVSAWVAGHL